MNPEIVSSIFGLLVAIATISGVFLLLGAFCYAVTRVFWGD